jgi:MFS superfamily sulfate permease-like transporter
LLGAVSAATISLPMAIGYGITAFSALGNDFIPQAAVIGIKAAILSCLFTTVFSSTPTVISGPSAALTIVINGIVFSLILHQLPILLGIDISYTFFDLITLYIPH